MEAKKPLFADFEGVSKSTWKAKIVDELKGADYDRRLVWKTDEGFDVQPFYTSEDLSGNPLLDKLHSELSQNKRAWTNYIELKADDEILANQKAKNALNFGANGFIFLFESNTSPDFSQLLDGLDISKLSIALKTGQPNPDLIGDYLSFVKEKGLKNHEVKGFVYSDILEQFTLSGNKPSWKPLQEILKKTMEYPWFYGLGISSTAFVDSGSNSSQELAFTLNKLTDYIEHLSPDLSADQVFKETHFTLGISGDYFFEMAKLRACRLAVDQVAKCYEIEEISIPILSTNSSWSKALYDPYVNMLRNTTEAMSAILGGCDGVLIKPHNSTFEEETDFGHRIALNISNVIKDESYFDKVSDPAGGSYYLESLTEQLLNKTLEVFQQIEKEGGFIAAFEKNIIQKSIAEVRAKKEGEIATRKKVFVGSNKYPNLLESIPYKKEDEKASKIHEMDLLKPQRGIAGFEQLRQETQRMERKIGHRPRVYLACFGNLGMRKARASFATDFFGTAGFEIMGEFFFDTIAEAVQKGANSMADIVVMCASDEDYATDGASFAKSFKAENKDKELVLAGYPANILDELKSSGVDSFIHIKTNAIEALAQYQSNVMAKS